MPTSLVRFERKGKEYFFLYSSVCDAPITPALTEEELRSWTIASVIGYTIDQELHGRLEEKIGLARKFRGSSNGLSFDEAMRDNAAGVNEQELTPIGIKRLVWSWRKNHKHLKVIK